MTVQFERAFGGRRVLVTGGAGFVGGAVVRRLVESGAKVTVLDDLFTGRAETIPTQAAFVKGSVTDQALVRELVAQSSLVFHMAARNIIASTANPRDDFETNIGGTLNVLLAARESRPDRVVYTSSTSVYGNPRSIPINEDDLLVPITPYAVSKLSGEHYCLAFYESYGLPVATVRYSNVYGPGQRPDNPYCGVVSKFLVNCHQGVPLTVHGDGEQTRDFTFIDDAVDATLLAATHPRAEGDVFNVGTGIETSVNQLAHLTGRAMDRDVEIRHIDRRDIDNIRRRVVNIEKARRMLRWSPQITMENGLRRTAEWFVAAGFADGLESDPVVAARGTTVRPGLEARAALTAAVATASEAATIVRAGAPVLSTLAGSRSPSTWRPTIASGQAGIAGPTTSTATTTASPASAPTR